MRRASHILDYQKWDSYALLKYVHSMAVGLLGGNRGMIETLNPGAWSTWQDKALLDRTGPAPDELVSYIRLVNHAEGYPAIPAAATAPPDFVDDLRGAIAELPASLKDLLDAPLLGVFFVRGLGCTAVTDVVRYGGAVLGGVVVLDIDVLSARSANAWATWKENQPFSPGGSSELVATIETPQQDIRKNAIQFILLHELGHLLTAGRQFLPDWWTNPTDLKPAADYIYLDFSWQIDQEHRIVPNATSRLSARDKTAFYTGALLPKDSFVDLYQELGQTSFVTLYAANNAYDDFAECFAVYVHTVVLGRPYTIESIGQTTQLLSDRNLIAARCAGKFAFVQGLLANV